MKMDTVAASSTLASTTTVDKVAQASTAVPTVLVKVKKEIKPKQRVAESKKRVAR
jgi:hypothetical protein